MVELLSASPLMTLFFVVAVGAIIGVIPFGPLKFGAAGALFVGLVVGYFVPELGDQFELVQNLGLALFVYTVGLAAGQTFFSDLKKQSRLMLAAIVILVIAAVLAIVVGNALGLGTPLSAGSFAGSLTATPALAAAQSATGSAEPSVGYSLGYPMGVIVAIILVSLVVSQKWPGNNDTESRAGKSLSAITAIVEQRIPVRKVTGWKDGTIRMSYLQRGDDTRVVSAGEELLPNDRIVVVGMEDDVDYAVAQIGHPVPEHLANDRSTVDFRQFVVSNDELAGRSIAELNISGRFGGVVTRIHRGDIELLATDDMNLELGDRVMVAFPRAEYDGLEEFFGNSERSISEVDAISLGLGIVLGMLLGMIEISLPGGSTFSLGAAAGPLIVGMILGYLQRTGPLVWQMPIAANLTIRQLGLLLFLASAGIASGEAFMETAATMTGVKGGLLAIVIAGAVVSLTALAGRVLGLSAQRTAGAMAGILGQPAILAYASSREEDERIESGYAALFALAMIVKILLVYVIVQF